MEHTKRKFQVSRSHLLEFDQFARVLNILYENKTAREIGRNFIIENTGLPDGQVASLVSIGAAMGLIRTGTQVLTPMGLIIAKNDMFLENMGTLEWCHYTGAGSYQNMIWFEVFNNLLVKKPPMTAEEWQVYFKTELAGRYSKKTIHDHVPKEVNFIINAYLHGNFSKLEILCETSDSRFYRRRYANLNRLILCAMVYDFCALRGARLFQVSEMTDMLGSPAVIFGLDSSTFRHEIEALHDRGWLRYETTHNLDQIRLKPGFSTFEFLSAHFEDREPREDSRPSPGGIFQ